MNAQEPDFDTFPIAKGVLASLQQGVAVFDANRKLLYINPAMTSVTGSGVDKVGGSLEQLSQPHRLRTPNGEPVDPKDFPSERAFAGEEIKDEPYLYIGPDGRHAWLSISTIRLLDETGNLQYVISMMANISARKAREDKLKFMVESAKILSITADFHKRLTEKARLTVPLLADWCAIDILDGNKTDRVVVVHQDQKMIDYIYEFQKKYPPDISSPTSVYNTIKNLTPQFIPRITDEMLRAGSKTEEQYQDIKKLQLNSLMVIPITAQGKGLGAMTLAYAESGRVYSEDDLQFFREFCAHLGVVLDNAQLYDAIKKRDEAKDIFLASLSHELRNPLAPIKSALEVLKIRDVPEDMRDEIDIIEHQFDHMAHLLNDLLDVTRFTHSKISISPSQVDLRTIVERALKSSEVLMKNADIALQYKGLDDRVTVLADETRIEQAISNLMSNAIKFTPAGGTIVVELERTGTDALIHIRDNGVGIHPDDIGNIFDMYYQGGYTRGYASAGLGIGLLLVRRIVNMHDGSIEAKSEGLGKGSEFTIRLPLSTAEETSNEKPHVDSAAAGKRILIVDDNVQAADSLTKLLNKVGSIADAVYSGDETLTRNLSAYDLLIIDVGMPRMDGYEVVKQLRSRGITIPIVALTGYGTADDKKRATDSGFTAHLTKPVGLKDLNEVISSIT